MMAVKVEALECQRVLMIPPVGPGIQVFRRRRCENDRSGFAVVQMSKISQIDQLRSLAHFNNINKRFRYKIQLLTSDYECSAIFKLLYFSLLQLTIICVTIYSTRNKGQLAYMPLQLTQIACLFLDSAFFGRSLDSTST